VTERPDDGSRVEAAEAGVHAEYAEEQAGLVPDEHVTATDAPTEPAVQTALQHHHHHPVDPNVGVVRGRTGRGALIAALASAAVTVVAVVLLALAIRGGS
jgi:hypothetical protein